MSGGVGGGRGAIPVTPTRSVSERADLGQVKVREIRSSDSRLSRLDRLRHGHVFEGIPGGPDKGAPVGLEGEILDLMRCEFIRGRGQTASLRQSAPGIHGSPRRACSTSASRGPGMPGPYGFGVGRSGSTQVPRDQEFLGSACLTACATGVFSRESPGGDVSPRSRAGLERDLGRNSQPMQREINHVSGADGSC